MPISELELKELGRTMQGIAERLNDIHESISKLGAGLAAVKAALAVQMRPENPTEALAQLYRLEENYSELDPNAATRKKVAEAIEMLKLIDKHGGPKEA